MNTTQPEALRLADELCEAIAEYPEPTALEAQAAAELRTQHARITELESQLAQRFDAADMATASAQGFRDGVASVSRLTDLQIASACMSYRHDFGLLDDAYKEQLVYEARSWEYAFAKEREWAAADGESNG